MCVAWRSGTPTLFLFSSLPPIDCLKILPLVFSTFVYLSWCCYITVDPEMHTSQNGFSTYKLHTSTNIIEKMTKMLDFITFIFYHRPVVKKTDTFIGLYKHRSVMQPLQNPPLCGSTLFLVPLRDG